MQNDPRGRSLARALGGHHPNGRGPVESDVTVSETAAAEGVRQSVIGNRGTLPQVVNLREAQGALGHTRARSAMRANGPVRRREHHGYCSTTSATATYVCRGTAAAERLASRTNILLEDLGKGV
jgi:hypothetical protein